MKKNEKNKISIVMGIYNCEKYLSESIESILSQTISNWELIMCDDGSKDNTLKIAKSYAKKYPNKIKVLVNKKNMGLNYTLNKCIKASSGEFIARQDGDDISLLNRLEIELEFLNKNPEYSLVSSNMIFFDENGDWGQSHNFGEVKKENFIKGSPICHAPCMIRKDALLAVGGYSVSDKLLRVEDYHLWFKLYIAGYKCYNLKECLYKMRDDNDAYKRRTLKNRLNETRLKLWGFRKIKIPITKYIWAFKPIVALFLPKKIYQKIHSKNLANTSVNKKIRVAQFVGTMNCGGTETMLMNLFRNFDKQKYEFYFIENKKEKSWYDDEIESLGGHIVRINNINDVGIKKYIQELIFIFKNKKINVVHSHVFLHSGIVMYAAKKAGIKVRISHSHSAMSKKDNSRIKLHVLRHLILKYSTHIAACSTEAGICLFGDIFTDTGLLLNNPIELDKIKNVDKQEVENLRKQYSISKNTLVIGHVGRLVEVKNHSFLIKLAQKLKEENIDFKMFFIGDGILKKDIIKQIKEKKLDNHIILTGNIPNVNVYDYMKLFDIFLLPSIYEGLPVTLIEAQASNLYSIVSSNISKECDLGLELVKFESISDIDSWKDDIINFKKKKISSKKIYSTIDEKKYSFSSIVPEYEKLYNTSPKKEKSSNKKNIAIAFTISIILAILAIFFYPDSEYDLNSYYSWMDNMLTFNTNDLINYIFYRFEFVIMTYLLLIAKTGLYNMLQFFPTLIFYFIMIYTILDYSSRKRISTFNKIIVIILFLSLFKYVFVVACFRYVLAYSLFFFGLYLEFIKGCRDKKSYMFYVIPIFIHTSSILLLLFRLLCLIKNKYIKYGIVLFTSLIVLYPQPLIYILRFFSDIQIIKFISDRINMYLINESIPMYFQYLFRIIQTVLLFILFIFNKRNFIKNKTKRYYDFIIPLGIFAISVFMYYTLFMRLVDFILCLSIIPLVDMLKTTEKSKNNLSKIVFYSFILIFIICGIRIQIPIFIDMYF